MISNLSRPKRRKSKVVPINQPQSISRGPKVIASDEATNRIIISIGGQRLAYDFSTRIIELPPTTGDKPASVVPLKRASPPSSAPRAPSATAEDSTSRR